jgi:hypothetical protein
LREDYVLRYELTVDDMVSAGRLYQQGLYRWVAIASAMTIVAGLLISGVAVVLGDSRGLVGWGVGVAILGAITYFLTQSRGLSHWATRRQARSVLGGTVELKIGDRGLVFVGPIASGFVEWSKLTGVREDERTVLFERDRILIAYAPLTAFESMGQRAEIIAFVRGQIEATRASMKP